MASKTTDKTTALITAENGSAESIITASSILSPVNDSTRLFDFSGLPRELRDKIYEEPVLFEYEHLPAIGEPDWITKAKKLRTSLLLVSRQFRDEYTERCAGQQVLCMRDHCMVRGAQAILPSPNRARFCTMEFHFIPNAIDEDFEGLNEFLVRWAAPDLAVRSIDLKLNFVDMTREQIEGGYVRHAIYSLQAFRKVASVELYLTEILWDFRNLGKPKELIARWDGGDDMRISFLTPAIQVHDTGSEWGNHDDIDPECCDPLKFSVLCSDSGSEEDDDDQSGSGTEREYGSESDLAEDSKHDGDDIESVDGHDDESDTP
jgi:hypothetical protein